MRRRPVRRARPEAVRRCGPRAAAWSVYPLPVAWWGHLRSAQPAVARRVVPAAWPAQLSGRLHSEASSVHPVHRDVSVALSSRQVPGLPQEVVGSGPVWWSAQAAACLQPGEAVAAQAMVLPSEMKAAAVVAE